MEERNARFPGDSPGQQGLTVPGDPINSTPLGFWRRQPREFGGCCQKSTTSTNSSLACVRRRHRRTSLGLWHRASSLGRSTPKHHRTAVLPLDLAEDEEHHREDDEVRQYVHGKSRAQYSAPRLPFDLHRHRRRPIGRHAIIPKNGRKGLPSAPWSP